MQPRKNAGWLSDEKMKAYVFFLFCLPAHHSIELQDASN